MAVTMTVNMRKQLVAMHSTMRRSRAPVLLKAFIARHQKVDVSTVKLDSTINEYLSVSLTRGVRPIVITVEKTTGGVSAKLLAPYQKKPEAKKAPEKKPEAKATEQKAPEQKKEKPKHDTAQKPAQPQS